MPRVAVLLPARDAAATLRAAAVSVLRGTLRDLALVIVDDGSRDATGARLRDWARRDRRVRVLSTGGLGLVGALQLGLAEARAPLLARMDADDESLPTRLEQSLVALARAPELAGVGTGVELVRADRPPSPNLQAYARWLSSLTSPALVRRDRFIESPLCHPSVTLRTDVLRAVGGWRDEPVPEDWELWLRMLEAGHGLSCLPATLHRWTDHDRRLTRTDARYELARHLDLKADYLARALRGRPLAVFGVTDTGRGLARRLRARGLEVRRYVELAPRKVGQRVEGVPVVHLDAAPLEDAHALLCVAAKGARDDLRARLTTQGLVELRDFTACA